MERPMRNPFSAGRWVSGDQFFGRELLIRSLIEGNESCDWIIGKRRVGKTSLLRQLERKLNEEASKNFGLYWDIQGSFDSKGLLDSLFDALEDSQDLYEAAWENLNVDIEDADSCPQLLKLIARDLQKSRRKLYLLIDEAEELITIGTKDSSLLKKMRRFFQSSQNTHTIITSTPRLEQLYSTMETETSPFLHGFTVSFLGNLDRESSDRLLAQGFDRPEVRDRLYRLTDGNPFELQLLAKHFFENNSMEEVLAHLQSNPMLNQTIEVNLDLLDNNEKLLLSRLHEYPEEDNNHDKSTISKLLHMGYLRMTQAGNLEIGSCFQARYLGLKPTSEPEDSPAEEDAHPLCQEAPMVILSNILGLYRTLLEASQQGSLPGPDTAIWYSASQDSIFLDTSSEELVEIPIIPRAWIPAVKRMMVFLDRNLKEVESWPYFRLKEMYHLGPEEFTEKEFLDLMLLIAEEASLESRTS